MKKLCAGFCLWIVAVFAISANAATLRHTVNFTLSDFSVKQTAKNGTTYDLPFIKGCYLNTNEAGSPQLPVKVVRLLMPFDATVLGVNEVATSTEPVGAYNIIPVQPPYPLDGTVAPSFVEPDPNVYNSTAPYPGIRVEFKDVGAISEYRIVEINVYPLQYTPATGKLTLYNSIAFELEYAVGTYPEVSVARRSEFSQNALESYVASLIDNKAGMSAFSSTTKPKIQKITKAEGISATPAPSTDGMPVDYVIITTDKLVPEFQRLADWKNKKGIITVIKTVEWIKENYEGVDTQEKIRNFIKACWKYWGTTFVLIGGDVDQVPVRNVWFSLIYGGVEKIPEYKLPTDLYYSDIIDGRFSQSIWEYNYNADDNAFFGEAYSGSYFGMPDKIDFLADIFLGRAPVENLQETKVFVDKILLYEKNPPVNFAQNVLLMSGNGYSINVENVHNYVLTPCAPWIDPYELYNPIEDTDPDQNRWSGDDLLTPESAVSAINTGYNLIYHNDHGGFYEIDYSPAGRSGLMYRKQADELVNGNSPSIFITPACDPNAFDYNCFSEHMMNNPTGGVSAFIGNTRVGWGYQDITCQQFFAALFESKKQLLGQAFNIARNYGTQWYWAYCFYAFNMLGDPTMLVWTKDPIDFEATHNAQLSLSDSLITVDIANGVYPDSALICLQKANEIYEVKKIEIPGSYTFKVKPQTQGDINITISGPNFKVYEGVCAVTATSYPHPYIASYYCHDGMLDWDGSRGNKDFLINPGEDIALHPTVINNGGLGLVNLKMTLRTEDPSVTLVDSMEYISPFNAGDTVCMDTISGKYFLFNVSPAETTGHVLKFMMHYEELRTAGAVDTPEEIPERKFVWDQPIKLTVLADSLEYLSHKIRQEGGNNYYLDSLFIANYGIGAAYNVVVTVKSGGYNPVYITVIDGLSEIGDIPGKTKVTTGDGLAFKIINNGSQNADDYRITLNISDCFDRTWSKTISLLDPPEYTSATINANGISSTEIKVIFSLLQGVKGYNLYRKSPTDADYVRINKDVVQGSSVYVDNALIPNTVYQYDVTAIDQYGLESNLSGLPSHAVGKTQPSQDNNYPVTLGIGGTGTQIWGTPAVGDINNDGSKEIIMGYDDGKIYAFDKNGQVLLGWPVVLNAQIDNSPPALADLDNDGYLEVILGNGGWASSHTDNLVHVFRYDGTEQPGWPQPAGLVFSSCAVADINSDGWNEIIAGIISGYVFAWDKDGKPMWCYNAGGSASGRIASAPAIGNLDSDPELEIVISSVSDGSLKLSILDNDGNNISGWPVIVQAGASSVFSSPTLADINKDGKLEILIGSDPKQGTTPPQSYIYCYNADNPNSPLWFTSIGITSGILTEPVVGDISNDGALEIIVASTVYKDPATGTVINPAKIHILSNSGIILRSIEFPPNGRTGLVIGDINNDNKNEILATSELGYLYAYNGEDGSNVDGYPIWIEPSWSAPLITDVDNDGKLDLIATGWGSHKINVFNLDVTYNPQNQPWATFHHDMARTGCYNVNAQLVSNISDATAYNNGRKLVFDNDLVNHLVYTSNNKVYYTKSYDPATGWEPAIALGQGKYPSIAIDQTYETGIETDVVWNNTTTDGHVQLWVKRSNEGAATLLKDLGTVSNDFNLSCSPPSIATKADTAFMVYLYASSTGIPPNVLCLRNIVFAKWPVGKYNEYQEEIVDTWEWNPYGPAPRSPSITIDNKGYVNLAWERMSRVEEQGDIWWTVRYPGGGWHHKENISNSYAISSIEPSLSTYGNVHLAWEENGEIFYRECVYQPTPTIDGSLVPPQEWDPYVWSAATNISQTPDYASLQPVFCDNYISYMEQQPGNDYEIMLAQKNNSVWQPVDGGNISQNLTQMSGYPHLSSDGSSLHSVWSERNDWGYGLKHYQRAVVATALFQVNVGDSLPSPYTVQRDGYLVYGTAKSKANTITVDYDTTELVYRVSGLNPGKKQTLEISLYQQNDKAEKWQYTICLDSIPIQTILVPSGVATVIKKEVPAVAAKDSMISIRILKKKGAIVTCDWWQLYEDKKGNGNGGAQSEEITSITPNFINKLCQNSPNPFNGKTSLMYQIKNQGLVTFKVYNALGQLVNTLVNETKPAGAYQVEWDGRDGHGLKVSSGVYIYRLQTGDFMDTKKMVIIK